MTNRLGRPRPGRKLGKTVPFFPASVSGAQEQNSRFVAFVTSKFFNRWVKSRRGTLEAPPPLTARNNSFGSPVTVFIGAKPPQERPFPRLYRRRTEPFPLAWHQKNLLDTSR
jgi:hypothetical protein